jgi:small-conductance mechanosensitive channel
MPVLGFVLLVLFVTWVWVWFAIVLVKCEGNLRTCGQWRLALDIGGLVMWASLAWVVWWRTRGWAISLLLIVGSIGTRLPIYVPTLPLGSRALGIIILSLGLILALIALFRSAEKRPHVEVSAHTLFAAGWFRLVLVLAGIGTLIVVSVPYLMSWLAP